jgi:hypothetical protein
LSVIGWRNEKGEREVFDFSPDEWETIADGEDIAVVPLELMAPLSPIPTSMFANAGSFHDNGIGVGDDTFMVGLFLDQFGGGDGVPLARFGNLSMIADEKRPVPTNNPARTSVSHVVDMHSRTGFSGSPVFVYRTFGQDLARYLNEPVTFDPNEAAKQIEKGILAQINGAKYGQMPRLSPVRVNLQGRTIFKFLGMHWGQFTEEWQIKQRLVAQEAAPKLKQEYVSGLSGMTCVVPAWKIMEVLEMPTIKAKREKAKATRRAPKGDAVVLESARKKPSGDDNPNHERDFENLLSDAIENEPPKGGA